MKNKWLPVAGTSRKGSGQTLTEILIALCVLGVIVPPSIEALGIAFATELRIHERARKAFYAEWWFNRLELPVSQSMIDAAPPMDESGTMYFSWETEVCEYDAIRITLHVSNGTESDVPFTVSRVY
jgi:hypothetical protein